jgi:hypothetical protein
MGNEHAGLAWWNLERPSLGSTRTWVNEEKRGTIFAGNACEPPGRQISSCRAGAKKTARLEARAAAAEAEGGLIPVLVLSAAVLLLLATATLFLAAAALFLLVLRLSAALILLTLALPAALLLLALALPAALLLLALGLPAALLLLALLFLTLLFLVRGHVGLLKNG